MREAAEWVPSGAASRRFRASVVPPHAGLFALCVGWATLCGGPASAAPPAETGRAAPSEATLERARELAQNGRVLYGEGNFSAAISAFEEAYRLARDPNLLYNISVALERSGRYLEAADALDRYRVYATAQERDTLKAKAASLREQAQTQRLQAEAAERAAQEARAAAEAEGRVSERDVGSTAEDAAEADGGEGSEVGTPEVETPEVETGPAGSRGASPPLVAPGAWALAGVAAVGLGAGVGLGVAASGRTQGIEDACVGGLCPSRIEGELARARGLALGADVAFGVAGVAAIAFAVWVGVRGKKRRAGEGAWAGLTRVSPTISPRGAGLGVRGRF